MNVEEGKTTARPYDDVFRTLLNDCSSLIIPVINEVFREDYSGKERIVFSPNEHFMNRQDSNTHASMAIFLIARGNKLSIIFH